MSAEDFLRRVEQTGLVSEPLMEELRKRVAESGRKLRPEMLAKLLVDREELTPGQARKIIAQMSEAPAPAAPPMEPDEPEEEENSLTLVSENDDLDFATEDDEPVPTLSANDVLGDRATQNDLNMDLDGDDILGDLGADSTDPPKPPPVPQPPTPNDDLVVVEEEEVAEAILLDDDDEVDQLIDDDAGESSASVADPVLDDVLGDPMINESKVVIRRRKGFWGLFDGLFPKRGPRRNRWDSPLILIGSGALALLIFAAVAFFGLFRGESAEKLLSIAEGHYENQSYANAISTYQKFNNRFAEHPEASLARVRIGMSKIRQITDVSTADWESALSQAKTTLPTIKTEEAFSQARSELAKLLPDISAGLVEKSKKSDTTDQKERVLNLADDAMTLVDNSEYLPTSVRQPQDIRIEEITTTIQVVRRDIERERALASTVAEIKTAADAGDITKAYSLRDVLMDRYPILIENVTLRDTLSGVTAKERDAVKNDKPDLSPLTDDHAADARLQIVLSDQRGETINGVDNAVLGVLVRGAVYGLRANDGQVLWRRYVGYECDAAPQPVAENPSSDFLVVDAHHGELQRLNNKTGALVWRLPCPKPISTPLVFGNKAYVTCGVDGNSSLLSVQLADGQIAAAAQFPVGCSVAPNVVPERNELIQAGIHSSVYVLDANTLTCKSVFSPGHARGSAAVPAFEVAGTVMLAENNGRDAATLHAFAPSGDDWIRAGMPIKVRGQIKNRPSTDGRRALVVSELGELRVLDVPIDTQEPKTLANSAAGNQSLGSSFGLLERSRIFVANNTLSRYELQSTRGEVVASWSRDRQDVFVNPLRRIGEYLFHVRRRAGMQGATVAATRIDGNGQPIWQTDVGVPSRVVVNSNGKVHVVTMNGAMFPVQAKQVLSQRSGRIDETLLSQAFSQQLSVTKDSTVFVSPPPNTHFVAADLNSGRLQRIPLRIDPDIASTPLSLYANSLLAPSEGGAVYLLDAANGRQRTSPFTPRLDAGSQVEWRTPTAIGSREFVIADKNGQLYRVTANGKQLTLASESSVDGPLVAGLASAGNFAYAVTQLGGTQELVAIDGSKLESTQRWPLNGGLAWGPKQVGSLVVVADGANSAIALNGSGKQQFQVPNVGPLAGDPLLSAGSLIFTSTDGRITVVGTDGQVKATKQYTEPFGSGAVAFKGRLLVAGWDGTLYLVDVPQ